MKRYELDIHTNKGKIHSELMYVKGSGWLPLPVLIYADGTAKTITMESEEPLREELVKEVGKTLRKVEIPAMSDLVMVMDEDGRGKPVNRLASEIMGMPVLGGVLIIKRRMLE